MTDARTVWLTPHAYDRLQTELSTLRGAAAPAEEAGAPKAVAQGEREARIREIQDLLNTAVVGQAPPDDGVAEPGMVLTIRYEDTDETETFLLGARGIEDGDLEVYSPESPLGRALTGARPGEQRSYPVPSGAELPVTLLEAVPYGQHRAGSVS